MKCEICKEHEVSETDPAQAVIRSETTDQELLTFTICDECATLLGVIEKKVREIEQPI